MLGFGQWGVSINRIRTKKKYEHGVKHPSITTGISKLNNYTKRKFSDNQTSAKVINKNRKKAARINARKRWNWGTNRRENYDENSNRNA